MKKNLFFGLFATMMLLLTTACQQDEVFVDGNATVTFKVSTPEMVTRAYSDGTMAKNLQYHVYLDENGSLTYLDELDGTKTMESNGATVSIDLATGKTYHVLFWAAADGAPYAVDPETHTMTVNYTGALNNDEKRDAFYSWHTIQVNNNEPQAVKLLRPFAQLNIGTDDINEAIKAGLNISQIGVTVSKVYTTLNFADGSVDGLTTVPVVFGKADRPENETFPVQPDTYKYLAMNYLLVSSTKSIADVEMSYDDQTRTYTNIPLQRNYRTNIYGSLLTKGIGFNVEIEEDFDDSDENIEVWDGKKVTKPAYDSATRTYSVKNGAELAWLAALVNGTLPVDARSEEFAPAENLDGETIVLIQNIDLGGKEWTPIGYNKNRFSGTFDGQGNTISGMTITEYNGQPQAALFGNVALTTTFKNLTISGANVVMPTGHTGDFYAAGLIGTFYGTVTIENVTVKESTFAGNNKVAGLIAHDGVSSNIIINNSWT